MKKIFITAVLLLSLFAFKAYALKNPAAVYCISMGYNYIVEKSGKNQCQIPSSGETFWEWDFYKGKVGQKYGYCALNGYEVKTITSSKLCLPPKIDDECAVCIINKEAVTIASAMKLDFNEAPCGDKICSLLENHLSCASDCPSGVDDKVCDGVADGKCDPDCSQAVIIPEYVPKPDPDCKPVVLKGSNTNEGSALTKNNKFSLKNLALLVLIGMVIAGLIIYYFKKKA
jgi:putative hemolysin